MEASTRRKARLGHASAIEQALQLLQRSCLTCKNIEPFPNIAQPFTHLAHPLQRASSIEYS